MLAFPCGMLNCNDNNFFRGFVNNVIDQIRIAACHQFTNAFNDLPTPDIRKQKEMLERFDDRSANAQGSLRIARANVVCNVG